jgi:outer membrane receptor protein involved in Fe transport
MMKLTSLFLVIGMLAPPVIAAGAESTSPAIAAPADQVQDANKGGTVDDQSRLEEITVTATRRSQSVEKVPISINALGQDELRAGSIKDIGDIAAVTPGLQFGNLAFASTLTLISIRGLNSLFGASTVGIYLDDTPIQGRLSSDGNVGNPYPAVFDLNRIEVLRGPQGTLFGAGSEAGNIRYITNQPSLTQFSGFTHAELSETEHGDLSYEIGAAAGGPIIQDVVGFRASVWERDNGGYVYLVQPWNGDVVARNENSDRKLVTKLAFGIQAADSTLITPSVFYQDAHADGNGRFDPNFSNPSEGQFNNTTLLPETSSETLVVPSLKVESHLAFADLTGVVSYEHRTVNLENDLSGLLGAIGLVNYGNPLGPSYTSSPSDVSPFFTGTSVHAVTEEVRLASNNPDAFFTWVAGIFNDHRTQADYQLEYSQLLAPSGHEVFYTLQSVTDDQTAVFAQGDLHLTSQWIATLGVRVADVKTLQTNINGTGALDAVPPYAETNLRQTPTTPRLSISYQADKDNLFYASAGKGFRIGGGNDPLPAVCGYSEVPKSYTADFIWSYEIGAKNKLFDGKMEIDSSAFHINWSNIQQLAQPACGISYTFNAGSAVSNGFDLALQALPIEHVKLDFSVGYADAHFTTNVYDSHGNILVESGDKIGYLPFVISPWNVNTAGNYEIPLSRDGESIHFRAEYQYHSRNPGPFTNYIANSPGYSPQQGVDPATQLVNARVGFTRDKVDLGLFVNNVFDSHPELAKYGQALLSAPTFSTFRPRTIGLSANVSF